ncbi:MAG: efflux RND transporter periplasmic adaptor subunit [Bacteroidales bacterium]
MSPTRARLVFCTAVLPILLVLATACSRPAASAPRSVAAAAVQVAVVNPTPVEDASTYLATVQSLSTTSIKPQVSGDIVRIHVKSGDRVQPGQPLMQIDPRVQRAAVTSQSAASAAQEAVAANARQQFERAKTLLSVGAISQQDFDQARANAEAAGKQLSSLNARVQQEEQTLEYYEVRAPAAGIVGDIPIRVGMRVTADTVLTTVNLNQSLEVYVQVPLDRGRDLRLGLPMQLFDGASNAPIGETTVSYVSPTVDDQTQSVLVKGRLPGNGNVRSLQFVRARIIWQTTNSLVVPVLAVQRINGQPFVFVAEQDGGRLVAHQRAVEVGEIVGNNYRIVQGLEPGERVVVSGVQRLANGAPIRPA